MTTHTPDKPERPRTLGRTVHEKYPAAVVGEAPELTLIEGGERGSVPGPTESEHTTNSPASPGERDAYRDDLTHVDEHGDVRMVDVSQKADTERVAVAEGFIAMNPATLAAVRASISMPVLPVTPQVVVTWMPTRPSSRT